MIRNENFLIFQLAVIQFTHIIDFMIIMPLGKQFMEIYDITPQQFSLLVSAYALMAFISGIIASLYIDRYDRRDALRVLYGGFIIGTFGCGLAGNYELFLAARAFTGAFGGILGALIFAIVADVVPIERRGMAMGKIMLAFSMASIVGIPAGIFLATRYGLNFPFLSIASIAMVFYFIAIWSIPSLRGHLEGTTGRAHAVFDSIRKIADDRNQRFALLFSFVLIIGHFIIIPFIAPYLELNIGFTINDIALLYLVGGVATTIVLPLFGYLGDRFGHQLIFAITSVGALFSIFAITNLSVVPFWLALLISVSFFMTASGRNVPATTLITSTVPASSRGSFMSIRVAFNEAGLAISSFIAGLLITRQPDGSLANYEMVGYVAIVMGIVAIFLSRKLKIVA